MLLPFFSCITLSGILFFSWKTAASQEKSIALLWRILTFLFASPLIAGVPIGLGIRYGAFWGLLSGALCCAFLFFLPRLIGAVLRAVREEPEPEKKSVK